MTKKPSSNSMLKSFFNFFVVAYIKPLPVLSFLLTIMGLNSSYACTRIINAANPQSIIVGRTMDWSNELNTNLWILPRGVYRTGRVDDNAIVWQSKYGSIIATAYDTFTTDGLNDQGLAAHILWLDNTDYGTRDTRRKGLSVALWTQFYLDNFKSVDEAVNATETNPFQVVTYVDQNTKAPIKLHLAIEDASGDSAIIEYVYGEVHIYHDKSYTVLTNSPTFPKQLAHLRDYTGLGGNKPLPGTTDSEDRFVRSAYYLKYLPQPLTVKEAVAQTMSVLHNISEPYGISVPGREEVTPTVWHSLINLNDLTYYFNSADQMNYIWVNLHQFNLSAGAPTLKLDRVKNPVMMGNVKKLFKPADIHERE